MIEKILFGIFQKEKARIISSLFKISRDLDLAEDAFQEACKIASTSWKEDKLPDKPAAWLTTVAKHSLFRRLKEDSLKRDSLINDLTEFSEDSELHLKNTTINGEHSKLRFLLALCSSNLPEKSRAALALSIFCGLTHSEIAKAFLDTDEATRQMISRAKRKLKSKTNLKRIEDIYLKENISSSSMSTILATIYLLFNEGHLSSGKESFFRLELTQHALDLIRELIQWCNGDAEAEGLLALMLFCQARKDGRISESGELVLLEMQDYALYDQAMISAAQNILDAAISKRQPGQYQLQAAIASLHCDSGPEKKIDWPQICALYARLLEFNSSAVIQLNAAVAVAMAGELKKAVAWLNKIEKSQQLKKYHLFYAAKAELLMRLGSKAKSLKYLSSAIQLCQNKTEKLHLTKRMKAFEESPSAE